MAQFRQRKEDAQNRQYDTVEQVHQADQQPGPIAQRGQHNLATKNHAYTAKQLPQTLQKDGQQQMPSLWGGKREHHTFLTCLSELRSQKMALTQTSKEEEEATHAPITPRRPQHDSAPGELHRCNTSI